jgi:hypothetical protein
MDLAKVLAQLREELEHLDAAILSLERLHHTGHRRGRPPELLAEIRKPGRVAARRGANEPRSAVGGRKGE